MVLRPASIAFLFAALAATCALPFAAAAGPPMAHAKIGAWGVDLSAMDPATKPGDDFFRYANGHWYDSYKFKPDETYVGARADLFALRRARIHSLIEDAAKAASPDPIAANTGALYASFVDVARIDAQGMGPLAPDLARIRAITTRADLAREFAQAPLLRGGSPFESSTFLDFHAPGRQRYTVTPGGLGLEEPEAYTDPSPAAQKTRDAYLAYVEAMLRFAGEADAPAKAKAILDLETRLAKAQWPSADANNFLKTANDQSPAQLAAEAPGFDWPLFLKETGASDLDVIIVRQPTAMKGLVDEVNRTPLDVWRAWLAYKLVSNNAEYLSTDVAAVKFDFFDRRLDGQQEPTPRWSRGVDLVEGYMGQAVGKLYVEKYFPESSRRQVAAMFDNIRAVMRDRLLHAAWMSEPTRAEALRKIDALKVKIGYPTVWPDYSDLQFDRNDLYGNLRQARRHRWLAQLGGARRPFDPGAWQTTPQTSGAAADPTQNEVTVPAGALEAPFFDPAADPAVNYGGIGGVLGHELSHMFDELGRQMDETGALRDWWAPEDAAKYEAIAKRVEQEYDTFEALPGHPVNGKLTLNENIADISGLGIAYEAYHRSLGGRTAPVLDDFTGDQRFFLGWAQIRAGKMRDETLLQTMKSDPHAPEYFRVNGAVNNIDAWYAAFDVKPGDKLYRAPADRAKFW